MGLEKFVVVFFCVSLSMLFPVVRASVDFFCKHTESPTHSRMVKLATDCKFSISEIVTVPSDYYTRSLSERATLLHAPSTSYLCKTLIMHNTQCKHDSFENRLDSKYYAIIVQYDVKMENERIIEAVRQLTPDPKDRLAKSRYNFRLVPEMLAMSLTGYDHNAMTPLGWKCAAMPIFVSHHIVSLPYMFLGGGGVDLKWRVGVADFVRRFSALVARITET